MTSGAAEQFVADVRSDAGSGRIRVVPIEEGTDALVAAEECRHSHDAMTVGALADIAGYTRSHSTLLVPEAPRRFRNDSGAIVVLCAAQLPVAAIQRALRQATHTTATVVVVQQFGGTDACLSCTSGMRYVETAQQEQLDEQLAQLSYSGRHDHSAVPLIGEIVWDGLPTTVRRIASTTTLLVIDSSSLGSATVRAAVTTALNEAKLPVLVVTSPASDG